MSRAMNYGVDVGRKLLKFSTGGPGLNRLLRQVRMVEFSPSRCVVELTVGEEHANPHGTLHGGYSSLLLDGVTTLAVIGNGRGVPGVSVDMNISFLKSAKIGDDIRVVAECIKSGKSMVFATMEIRLVENGKLIATGSHIKHVEADNSLLIPELWKETAV